MKWFDHQRTIYTLKHHALPRQAWEQIIHTSPIFRDLSAVERAHLRELTTLFLHRKDIVGVQGLVVSTQMALAVATQACLLILKLGMDYFTGWVEIIIYPSAFRVMHDERDSTGLLLKQEQTLSGESWARGPVIFSWDDVALGLSGGYPGNNVTVHEFAHKLDSLNGNANGMPPLHAEMHQTTWAKAFTEAFEKLQQQIKHHRPAINPYAATSPAEFFAVSTEYFFTAPQQLYQFSSPVYKQLTQFYRQEPISRWSAPLNPLDGTSK